MLTSGAERMLPCVCCAQICIALDTGQIVKFNVGACVECGLCGRVSYMLCIAARTVALFIISGKARHL